MEKKLGKEDETEHSLKSLNSRLFVRISDHGTLGGYPKLGVVISADYDKLVQIPPGSKVKFKEIELKDAENLYKLYNMETNNILNKII